MRIYITDKEYLNIINIDKNEMLTQKLKTFEGNDIVSIQYENNNYSIYSNKKYKILKEQDDINSFLDSKTIIENEEICIYNIEQNEKIFLYFYDTAEIPSKKFTYNSDSLIIAGKYFVDSNLKFINDENSETIIKLSKVDNYYTLETKDLTKNIYINNNIYNGQKIENGNIIFYDGFYMTIIDKLISIYYGNDKITENCNISEITEEKINYNEFIKSSSKNVFKEKIFKRTPKIKRKIETKKFTIDAPSPKELKESMPVIYTMLPMLLMSMTSIVSSANVINSITLKERTLEESMPSLIISGTMILSMIAYPIISHSYNKRRESKREIKRIEEYKDYIYEQKRKILEEMDFQKEILLNNFYDTDKSKEIIENKSNSLWERKKGIEDFLTFSLGTGDVLPKIEISIPEEHFTIDRDKLRIQLVKLKEETSFIKDAPITFDFNNNVVGIIGKDEEVNNYLNNLLIKAFATCYYEDLKIVILTNKTKKNKWKNYLSLPYVWSEDKSIRFIASDDISYGKIINYLDIEMNERENTKDSEIDSIYSNYIIIVDDIQQTKKTPMINEIIRNENNLNMTVIYCVEKLDDLPSECNNFLYIEKETSKLISNINKNYIEVNFKANTKFYDFKKCYQILSNTYLESFEKKFVLPTKYDFLKMYDCDDIESLNIQNRWANNSTEKSLSVPIGIDEDGQIFNLNLHENSHGPHGLVAGMTGSGKSELLITYILSLAINYSPEEVQFVLIDYKGGGLANTFYNSNIGMILPHVVGIITNIDDNEINRSLISLKSEIKRRQKIFAEVSKKYNEGNIDIYKYEQLYNKNNDIERLSHLIIISDEFAELKTQNPEFITELISISRIGRSLGIHLILSTQKPSGVVDDQIWSNSRFRICLKVQDNSDSNDMLKNSSAAMIKEPGRFYIQVGYNELFLKAQSAYAQNEFIKKDKNETIHETIDFINDCGSIYNSTSIVDKKEIIGQGKIVNNIVKQIIEYAKEKNISVKGLWRTLIGEKIYRNDLIQKYNIEKNDNIRCFIGEYDAPDKQEKGAVSLDLLQEGNIIIYGQIDSGQELLLEILTYDLIEKYTPDEINVFILDFGSEMLINYQNAPQVGDVVLINNSEKVNNLFKYLKQKIEERKKILSQTSKNFINYNQTNQNKFPAIIIEINVLENLFENYENLQEDFIQISRECNRYGIIFIVTTNNTNNLRTKITQNFKRVITLNLKDKFDYSSLLGSKTNIYPTNTYGRGLIKYENVYEFQTAYISNEQENSVAIENLCKKLNTVYSNKSAKIPTLPEKVTFDIIKPYLKNNFVIPIGIDENTLAISNYNFKKEKISMITGLEFEPLLKFYKDLENNIYSFSDSKIYIFDSYKKQEKFSNKSHIIKDNFVKYLSQLEEVLNINQNKEKNYIIFIGLTDMYNEFSLNDKKYFNSVLKKLNLNENFCSIILDTSNNIKKLEFEEFYRNNVSNLQGIWIGNGIYDQMCIKINRIPREYRNSITNEFGFAIENSNINKIKLLNYSEDNNEQEI